MFSSVIDLITDGLKEGITVWIGDNTTGRIMDAIGSDRSHRQALSAYGGGF